MKLIALFVLLGACNTGKPGNSDPVSTETVNHIRDTVFTKLNSSFTIQLRTTMGTGFRWELADSLYGNFLILDSMKVWNNVGEKDNAPDTQVFYFTAIRQGVTKLRFFHARPWEKNIPPAEEREFLIQIDP